MQDLTPFGWVVTDARGITYLTNEYDAAGRVLRQTQVDTGVWTLVYTVTGGRVTQTVITGSKKRGQATLILSSRFRKPGERKMGQATLCSGGVPVGATWIPVPAWARAVAATRERQMAVVG